ncbi:MAG: hypothetical protein PVSMB5_23490 [Ktedonobacteraceae bacterium]
MIYRYVYSKVGNREEAEDLTAQIFMKAVRGVDVEHGQLRMQKWLFQVARKATVGSLDELLDAGWEGPVEEEIVPGSVAPAQKVNVLLRLLSEQHREVLTCRFLLNLSIKETALRMGTSEANVKVLQFRALKRAAQLDPMLDDV